MGDLLCAAPRCAIPRRHRGGCDTDCRGCLPARAADGIRLCPVDLRRLATNAAKVAELHGELELVLKAAGNGERTASKPGPGTPPRDAVVEMRTEIRHVLVSWCRLISEERGFALPDDQVPAMGAYIARYADWLAAQEYAGEVADELAGLASRAWGVAYQTGTRRVVVGPCPLCGGIPYGRNWAVEPLPPGFIGPPQRRGRLQALRRERDQDKLPSEVYCDMVDEHRWPAERWRELDRLVTRGRVAA
jgi:hypothetical protein